MLAVFLWSGADRPVMGFNVLQPLRCAVLQRIDDRITFGNVRSRSKLSNVFAEFKRVVSRIQYFGCSFVNYCPTQVRSVVFVYCPTEIFVCFRYWKWPDDKPTHFQRRYNVLLQMSTDGLTTLTVSFCFRNFSTVLIILTMSSQPKMTIFLLPFVPFLFPLFIVNVTGFWNKKKRLCNEI